MKIDVIGPAAVIREPGVLITDSGSAMDVLATVRYETGCSAMILRQEQLDESFSGCPAVWRVRCCKNL